VSKVATFSCSRPLVGRQKERARLDAFVAGVRFGQNQVLAFHGEPGVAKSAHRHEASQAERCHISARPGDEW
jgi:hypothetical protein